MATYLDKIKVFERPDGSVSIHYFVMEAMQDGETEDDFIARIVAKIKRDLPEYNSYIEHDMVKADVELNNRKDRQKLRIKSGKVKVDNTVETDEEKKKAKKDKAKTELKALGLSNEAIEGLLE